MSFNQTLVQPLNSVEQIDSVRCSTVPVLLLNQEGITRCSNCVFKSSKFSPLKGRTGIEHAAAPFGDGRRV